MKKSKKKWTEEDNLRMCHLESAVRAIDEALCGIELFWKMAERPTDTWLPQHAAGRLLKTREILVFQMENLLDPHRCIRGHEAKFIVYCEKLDVPELISYPEWLEDHPLQVETDLVQFEGDDAVYRILKGIDGKGMFSYPEERAERRMETD